MLDWGDGTEDDCFFFYLWKANWGSEELTGKAFCSLIATQTSERTALQRRQILQTHALTMR